LEAVGIGVVLSQFVLASEASMTEDLLQVGAPIAMGGLVANVFYPPSFAGDGPKSPTYYATRALVGGVAGTAVLMIAGVMPVMFDIQTLSFVGLVGGSVVLGEFTATLFKVGS